MNIIKKAGSFLLFSLFIINKEQKPPLSHDYIALDFAYDVEDKPVPTIVFSIDEVQPINPNGLIFVGDKFRITKEEFLKINNLVKKQASYLIIDSMADRYYDFRIYEKGVNKLYATVNLTKTKQIFDKVLNILQNSKKYPQIKEAFDYVLSRIKPNGSYLNRPNEIDH
jgi:hypothetical protein